MLIVEDDVLTAWHLRSMVEELTLEVCGVVGSADEAIEQAAEAGPTLVLMDIRLGEGMDGIEAARRILQKRKVAVVFVTAYSDRRTIERIVEATGEARVVPKPVNMERLRKAIAAALSGNQD